MAERISNTNFRFRTACLIVVLLFLLLFTQTVFAQNTIKFNLDGKTINVPFFEYRTISGQTFRVPIIPANSVEQMIRNKPTNPNDVRIWIHPNGKAFFVDSGRNHIRNF